MRQGDDRDRGTGCWWHERLLGGVHIQDMDGTAGAADHESASAGIKAHHTPALACWKSFDWRSLWRNVQWLIIAVVGSTWINDTLG